MSRTLYVSSDVAQARARIASIRARVQGLFPRARIVRLDAHAIVLATPDGPYRARTADFARVERLPLPERPRALIVDGERVGRCACGMRGDPTRPIVGTAGGRSAAWASCPQHPTQAVGLPLGTLAVPWPADLGELPRGVRS